MLQWGCWKLWSHFLLFKVLHTQNASPPTVFNHFFYSACKMKVRPLPTICCSQNFRFFVQNNFSLKNLKCLLFCYFLTTDFDFRKKSGNMFSNHFAILWSKKHKNRSKIKKDIYFENVAKNSKNLNNSENIKNFKKIIGSKIS